MPIHARLDHLEERTDRRRAPRRTLRLEAAGGSSSNPNGKVLIHDLSLTGLLIETASSLPVGSKLQVELPEAGAVGAEVVWNTGRFYGCRFTKGISKAALSAALLRTPAHVPDDRQETDPTADALTELKVLRAQILELTANVESALDQLGSDAQRKRAVARADELEAVAEKDKEDGRFSARATMGVILLLSAILWTIILWVAGII